MMIQVPTTQGGMRVCLDNWVQFLVLSLSYEKYLSL